MIVCLSCGNANEANTGFCLQCNARLPKIDPTSIPSNTGHVTDRYNSIKEAAEKAKDGRWTTEELGHYLETLFELLESHKLGILGYVKETAYDDEGGQEVEIGVSGMSKYEEGLRIMFGFVETGEEKYLESGLRLIWEGNELINEAMRENRAARQRLQDEWGYMY